MTTAALFFVGAAILCLLALAASLLPLWRDRASRGLFLVLLLILPLGTWWLYGIIGTPQALTAESYQQTQGGMPETMEEAVTVLRQKLAEEPDNIEGWALLGNSLLSMDRASEAVSAWRQALALSPDDAFLKMELGNAILRASNPAMGFPDEARALLQQAYETDPQLQKAQWLLGIAAASDEDFEAALKLWEDLLPRLKPGTNIVDIVSDQIDQARSALGIPVPVIQVQVELATDANTRLTPDSVLFVFLHEPGGSGMPLAAKRLPAAGFPQNLSLRNADVLQGEKNLAAYPQLELSAKLSASGNPSDDDLRSATVTINPATLKERIVLQLRPPQ